MLLSLAIPLLACVTLIQTVVLTRVSLWGARPELLLLVVLMWSVVRGVDEGLLWAFLGGLMMELFSGGPLGAITLALVVASFLSGRVLRVELGSPVAGVVLSTLLAVSGYHLVLLLALAWTGYPVDWLEALFRIAWPSVLLNALLAPFVYRAMRWLERRTRRERFPL